MSQNIRKLTTFTNEELISIVDELIFYSRLDIPGVSYLENYERHGGDMSYRKIEVKLVNENELIFRVTFSEHLDSEKMITAIILEDAGNDIYIKSVYAGNTKDYLEELGVNFDYSTLHQGCRENYIFFAEKLQLWNLGGIDLEKNKNLSQQHWFVVSSVVVN